MADSDNDSGGQNNTNLSPREQDRFLPIANVSRIMKKALPANAKISKEAKETVQECVSEFISFITGEASDKCQREKRKTINGDDLLWAMTTLGFEEYVEPLKIYLQKFREMEGERSSSGSMMGIRHGGESSRDVQGHGHGGGGDDGSISTVGNSGNSGVGMYGGVQSTMMMMGQHQHNYHHQHNNYHQGHMYGSGSASGASSGRPR